VHRDDREERLGEAVVDMKNRLEPVGVQQAIDEHGKPEASEASVPDTELRHTDVFYKPLEVKPTTVNKSEIEAYVWLRYNYDFGELAPRRLFRGVDFAFGSVGFEVKSSEDYRVTDNQQTHMEVLSFTFIIVCSGERVWVEDCYVEPDEKRRFRQDL